MSQKKALAALSRREALLLAAGATMVAAGGVVLNTGSWATCRCENGRRSGGEVDRRHQAGRRQDHS